MMNITNEIDDKPFSRSQSTVQENRQTNVLTYHQPTKVPLKNFRQILNKQKTALGKPISRQVELGFKN